MVYRGWNVNPFTLKSIRIESLRIYKVIHNFYTDVDYIKCTTEFYYIVFMLVSDWNIIFFFAFHSRSLNKCLVSLVIQEYSWTHRRR